MRSLGKLVGVGALALVATAFLGVASASAQTDYTLNGTAVTGSVPTSTSIVGNLALTDQGVGITVTCDQADVVDSAGNVDTNGEGTVTAARAVDCDSSNPTACPTPDAEAFNLPWSVDLDGDARADIEADQPGGTGFVVTCQNGIVDTCVIAAGASTDDVALSEVAADGPVRGTFDAQTPDATCSLNGGVGRADGTVQTDAETGTATDVIGVTPNP